MFSSGIARLSAHVCLKFSKRVQLKLREICGKTLKSYAIKLLSYGRLLSTQEAKVVLGYRLGRLLRFFVLSNLPRASIT